VINPSFSPPANYSVSISSQTMRELNAITPAPVLNRFITRTDQDINQRNVAVHGIDIVDDIYQYLVSDALYNQVI
jgi:ureidoglycolate dehydrogenase (NAD+)